MGQPQNSTRIVLKPPTQAQYEEQLVMAWTRNTLTLMSCTSVFSRRVHFPRIPERHAQASSQEWLCHTSHDSETKRQERNFAFMQCKANVPCLPLISGPAEKISYTKLKIQPQTKMQSSLPAARRKGRKEFHSSFHDP